jgi:hypothetical protein
MKIQKHGRIGTEDNKFDPRKKQFKHPHHPSHSAPVRRNMFSGQQQSVSVQNSSRLTDSVNKPVRPPLQCWGCKEPHLYKYCPLNKNINLIVHNIQEAMTVNDMAQCTHKINAALENRQVDHQSAMVEIEGMINKKYVSILIDPGASLSYVSPTIVEDCKLNKVKHKKSWLVQLATGTK